MRKEHGYVHVSGNMWSANTPCVYDVASSVQQGDSGVCLAPQGAAVCQCRPQQEADPLAAIGTGLGLMELTKMNIAFLLVSDDCDVA